LTKERQARSAYEGLSAFVGSQRSRYYRDSCLVQYMFCNSRHEKSEG
jgi:hypothetical protein